MPEHSHELQLNLEFSKIIGGAFLQEEYGYFVTGLRNSVNYPGSPEHQSVVQNRLNDLVKRMALVYLFALFDHYFTDNMKSLIPADLKLRLRAFRHIRNSAAHGIAFERAPECRWRDQFEEVMASNNPIGHIDFNETLLDLTSSSVEIECRSLMEQISHRIMQPLYDAG